jgi:hypothetical protein
MAAEMAAASGKGGGFFSGGGMDFFKSKEGQQGLFAGLAGLGGGQRKEAAIPLPLAAMLAGFDPRTLAYYATQRKEDKEASPAGNIMQAMGPEVFSKLFSKSEAKGETKEAKAETGKVFGKAKGSKSIVTPPPNPTKSTIIPEELIRSGAIRR